MTIRRALQLLSHTAAVLLVAAAPAVAQTVSQNEIRFREARHKEQVEGDLGAAIKLYQRIASVKSERSLAARALVQLGRCYEKQGNAEARKAYERVLREFGDQSAEANEARMRLAKINPAGPRTGVAARKLSPPLRAYPLRTVTRDGRYTAYIFFRRSVIMLLDLTTGKEREVGGGRRLIPPGDSSLSAAISPDGLTIAYDQVHADGTCDLRIIGVNATEPRILQRGLNSFFVADWSRDGSTVLIKETQPTANPGPLRSLLVKVRTGEMTKVYSSGLRGSAILPIQLRGAQLRLSPDGRFVANTMPEAPTERGTGVFVTAVGDENPYKIAGSPADAYVFGWSPDGGQLLYVSDQSGSYDLWSVPMKDGRPRGVPVVLKKDLGMVMGSGIADDGSLYYCNASIFGNLYIGELDVAAAAVRNVQQIPQPSGHLSRRATWSPDGARLLIDRASGQFAAKGIIRDIATGEEQEVRPPEGSYAPEMAPDGRSLTPYESSWAPDGKSIVYLVRRDREQKPSQVIVANQQSGAGRRQFELPSRSPYVMPTVAPDGRYLYVAKGMNQSNATQVVRIDLQTGEERDICAARPYVWALSPDGTQIACAGFGDTIQILPTQGGRARDLVKGNDFGTMTWTADGQYLIYTLSTSSIGVGGSGVYWIVPAAGGTPRKLDIALGTVGYMSVHRDNRRIAIACEGRASELWVLENVLPASK